MTWMWRWVSKHRPAVPDVAMDPCSPAVAPAAPSALLEQARQRDLATWYADPLPAVRAQALLVEARRVQVLNYRRGRECFEGQLCEALGRAHLGHDPTAMLTALRRHFGRQESEHALCLLAEGQLALSRKRAGAWPLLQQGFRLAAPHLPAAAYFRVLRRHERLAQLVLGGVERPPLSLGQLLREAAVVQALRGGRRAAPRLGHDRRDTLG